MHERRSARRGFGTGALQHKGHEVSTITRERMGLGDCGLLIAEFNPQSEIRNSGRPIRYRVMVLTS